jgi:predicted amidophosphoribosyltransferase
MNCFIDHCLLCKKLQWNFSALCKRCRASCLSEKWHWRNLNDLDVLSLFNYVSPLDDIVGLLKDKENGSVSKEFGHLMSVKLSLELLQGIAGVIPMPPRKFGDKDHAYRLAEGVAEFFNVPLASDFLRRKEGDRSQKSLALEERQLTEIEGHTPFSEEYSGEKLWLLVDDVVTSGATLYKAWSVLGRPQALALTLATTPRYY